MFLVGVTDISNEENTLKEMKSREMTISTELIKIGQKLKAPTIQVDAGVGVTPDRFENNNSATQGRDSQGRAVSSGS